jgi:WD40 repeat protein
LRRSLEKKGATTEDFHPAAPVEGLSSMSSRKTGLILPLGLALVLSAGAGGQKPAAPEKARQQRTDLHGDPLPRGVVARLGTVRFRHGLMTNVVAFAPGGKILASGGRGGAGLCLWDAATGRPLHRIPTLRYVFSLAFSPDGKMVLVSGGLLFDVATGKELRKLQGARPVHEAVALSADGRTAAAGEGNDVMLWDVATGKELRKLQGSAGAVHALAFAPDGTSLAVADLRGEVVLWGVATGKMLRRHKGHEGGAWAVAFAPCGKVLASGGKDGLIRLWDVATGQELRQLKGHAGAVYALAFTPSGTALASGGADKTIRLWAPATGKEIRRWRASAVAVRSVAFAPGGKTLASAGGWDHALRLWDPATGKLVQPVVGHTGLVDYLRFAPDRRTLVSRGWDRRVLAWDLATGRERRLFGGPPPPAGSLWSAAALSPDNKVLALADWVEGGKPDPVIRLWDTATGKELRALAARPGWVKALAFSPDGRWLASGGRDGVCSLWEVATGKELRRLKGHPAGVRALAFAPDGRRLASAEYEGAIRLWEVATGKTLFQSRASQTRSPPVFSPSGKLLAAHGEGVIHVWDSSTGREVRRLALTEASFNLSLAFSPTGRFLAADEIVSSRRGRDEEEVSGIHVWELASGQEVYRSQELGNWAWSLAFAPDGRTLAAGGSDSTILLWDLTGRREGNRLRPARLSGGEQERLCTDLGGAGAKGYRAIWTLAAAPQEAVPLLKERLRPVAAPNARQISRWLADLDSSRFAVRRRATNELARLAEVAGPALRQALAGSPGVEVRRRLEQLVKQLESPITRPEALRSLRAVEVLEQIGTPQARTVLRTLAAGAPAARLTQEAKASLERLTGRD